MIKLPEEMTIDELAEGLKISPTTVRRRFVQGRIKAEKLTKDGTRKWIVKRDEVIKYLEGLNVQ